MQLNLHLRIEKSIMRCIQKIWYRKSKWKLLWTHINSKTKSLSIYNSALPQMVVRHYRRMSSPRNVYLNGSAKHEGEWSLTDLKLNKGLTEYKNRTRAVHIVRLFHTVFTYNNPIKLFWFIHKSMKAITTNMIILMAEETAATVRGNNDTCAWLTSQ